MSDISNISGNNSSITNLSNLTFRSKPFSDRSSSSSKLDQRLSSPHLKSLNSTKIFYESLPKQNTFITKSNHQTSSWSSNSTRTLANILRPKSHLSKHIQHHHLHEKFHNNNNNSKINSILDLYISPRTISNPHRNYDIKKKLSKTRFIIDECKLNIKKNILIDILL